MKKHPAYLDRAITAEVRAVGEHWRGYYSINQANPAPVSDRPVGPLNRCIALAVIGTVPVEAIAGIRPSFPIGDHAGSVLALIVVGLAGVSVAWRLNERLTLMVLRMLRGCALAVAVLLTLGTCAAQLYFLTK